MSKWEWKEDTIIRGTGELVKKGGLIKFPYISDFKVTIKGKLSSKTKLTRLIKIILDEEFEIDNNDLKYLPACVVEIVIKSFWSIDFKNIQPIFVDGKMFEPKYVLSEICELIQDNNQIQEVRFEVQEPQQGVTVNLNFDKKRVNGKIEFFDPISKRDAIKFLEALTDLVPLFRQKEKEDESKIIKFLAKQRFDRRNRDIPDSHFEYYYMRRHNL